mgnify:CR=1 FL=1
MGTSVSTWIHSSIRIYCIKWKKTANNKHYIIGLTVHRKYITLHHLLCKLKLCSINGLQKFVQFNLSIKWKVINWISLHVNCIMLIKSRHHFRILRNSNQFWLNGHNVFIGAIFVSKLLQANKNKMSSISCDKAQP